MNMMVKAQTNAKLCFNYYLAPHRQLEIYIQLVEICSIPCTSKMESTIITTTITIT